MNEQRIAGARRRGRLPALALIALMVLATACVRDLTVEMGGGDHPTAINDLGVLAGSDGDGRLWRYEPDGTRVGLADPGGLNASAGHINNAREVLGGTGRRSPSGGSIFVPVVWDVTGRVTDLGPVIPGGGRPDIDAYAVDLNDRGQALVVTSGDDESTTPATRVQAVHVVDTRAMTTVTVPGATWATAINEHGDIVGRSAAGWGRWTPQDGSYRYDDFGSFDDFRPSDVNNHGDLVGSFAWQRPAIWKAGTERPVALPAAGLPERMNVFDETFINDAGVVVVNLQDLDGEIRRRPARWAKPEAAPLLFPPGTWRGAQVRHLNNRGTALGLGLTADLEEHAIRWY